MKVQSWVFTAKRSEPQVVISDGKDEAVETFKRINQVVKGWINYFRIGSMKQFLDKFGQWLRHKIRVVIIKQWKIPKRIDINLQRLGRLQGFTFTKEDTYKVANSRSGWY